MSGDSTLVGPNCARCGFEVGGCSVWEGSLAYHPACAPSAIPVEGSMTEDQIMSAAGIVWDAEKAEVIHRLSTALNITGPVTLDGLLTEAEKRLQAKD